MKLGRWMHRAVVDHNEHALRVYKGDAWEGFIEDDAGDTIKFVVIMQRADGFYLGFAPPFSGIDNLTVHKLEGVDNIFEAQAVALVYAKMEN